MLNDKTVYWSLSHMIRFNSVLYVSIDSILLPRICGTIDITLKITFSPYENYYKTWSTKIREMSLNMTIFLTIRIFQYWKCYRFQTLFSVNGNTSEWATNSGRILLLCDLENSTRRHWILAQIHITQTLAHRNIWLITYE